MKEALKLAYDYIDNVDYGPYDSKPVLAAIKAALAQPEQEPYCYTYTENGEEYFAPPTAYVPDDATPLYTTPPQRTWVGLTDDEIYSVLENLQVMYNRPPTTDSRIIFARAIEAKLKEKNT